jgi:hypothetical protein
MQRILTEEDFARIRWVGRVCTGVYGVPVLGV